MNNYVITEVPELELISYTQKNKRYLKMFELDNLYFTKSNREKIEKIEVATEGNYVIFDTETNGLNNFGESLPFQIAAIKYRNGKEINRLNILINIGTIPDDILKLTLFNQSDIDHGIPLKDAMNEFIKFIASDKYIIAHNAAFYISILNNALVASNIFLQGKKTILCSMQMYYTVYKHIFELGISGFSLNQLSLILLGINISEGNRHQADYDVLLTKELIDKMKIDIDYDKKLGEKSAINRVLNIEDYIFDKISLVKGSESNTDRVLKYLTELGEEINNLFGEYKIYYNENKNIANAVSLYFDNILKIDELILEDELFNTKYYIKKNKPFSVIDARYANSYVQTTNKIYDTNGNEISFFVEDDYIDTNITDLNSAESLSYYISNFVENKGKMMKLQMRINYLLKIVKAHQGKTGYLRYGEEGKGIIFRPENIVRKNDRTIDKANIEEDIKKGLITSLEDLEEVKFYNTTLIVEQNLSNVFNLI